LAVRRVLYGTGLLLIAAVLLLGAYISAPTSKGASAGPSTRSTATGTLITISNFMFSPMALTVSPGATISVTNKDSDTHTLTATSGQFNTGDIAQNQTKTFKAPMHAGTYRYICNIHQYMMGSVTVN
jgi:plastocyanin